jgi:molecular chaperone HscB
MHLSDDDFSLLRLPRRQALARQELDERRRALQSQVHPDRFAAEGASAQRLATQWAVRVNEAYRRLSAPLSRAAYLCELAGEPVRENSNTAMPTEFLMRQMQWREVLEDTENPAALAALRAEVEAELREGERTLEHLIDHQADFPAACQLVREMMFVERFAAAVDDRLEALDAA